MEAKYRFKDYFSDVETTVEHNEKKIHSTGKMTKFGEIKKKIQSL